MNDRLTISRVRVSWVTARSATKITEALADPDEFEKMLSQPREVVGLRFTLPFVDDDVVVSPDRLFWSHVTERRNLGSTVLGSTAGLLRSGLPVRHRPPIGPTSEQKPRLEVFCRGSGCVVVASLDLLCSPAVDLAGLPSLVSTLDQTPLVGTVGAQQVSTTFDQLADECADVSVKLLSPAGEVWSLPAYRIVSVIAATGGADRHRMPPDGGPVHRAMHELACGQAALPSAQMGFLPYWAGRGSFGWSPTELVYLLDTGGAQLRAIAALNRPSDSKGSSTTSDQHRLLTLARAQFAADLSLLTAAAASTSTRLSAWADVAADRLSRMYGPAPASYDFWGLATRAFIESDANASRLIDSRRSTPLHGLTWPAYPTQ